MLTVTKESLVDQIKEQMESAINANPKKPDCNRDKQKLSGLVYLNRKKEQKIYHLNETIKNLSMQKPVEFAQLKDIKQTKDMIRQEDFLTVQLNRMKNNVTDSINNLKSKINHTEYLFNSIVQYSPGLRHMKVKSQMDLCGTIARRENFKKSFKASQSKRREKITLKKQSKKKLSKFIHKSVQNYAQTLLDSMQDSQSHKDLKKNIEKLTQNYHQIKAKKNNEHAKKLEKLFSLLTSHATKSSFSDVISYSNHLMYTSTHLEIRLADLTETQKRLQEELNCLTHEYKLLRYKIPAPKHNSVVKVNGNLEERCFAIEKLISLVSGSLNALKSKAENLMNVHETQNQGVDNNTGKTRTMLSPNVIHKLKTRLRKSLLQNSILDRPTFTIQEAEEIHMEYYGEALEIKKFLELVQSVLLLRIYFNKSNLQSYLSATEDCDRDSGDLSEYYTFTHNTIRIDLKASFQKLEEALALMNTEEVISTNFVTFSPVLPKINRTNRYKFILERKKSNSNARLEKNIKKRKYHMSSSVFQDIRNIRASINKFSNLI